MAAQCPICDMELLDLGAVREHTIAEHGVESGENHLGQWTTVADPAEPSWQPDPWNPNAQRWWDGSEWSGRVAPAGSTPSDPRDEEHETELVPAPVASPSEPPPAPPEQRKAERRRGDRRRPAARPTFGPSRGRGPVVAIGAASLVAVAIVAVVVFTSSGGSPPKANSDVPVVPQTIVSPATPQGLGAGLLEIRDLGTGWTPHPAGHPMAPADYTSGPCGSALWAHEVGGYQASFINGDATGQSHGAVVNEIRQAPSAGVATQQHQYIASPAFVTCLEQTDGQEALSQLPGARLGHVAAAPYALLLPQSTRTTVSSTAYVVTIPVTAKDGTAQSITDDSVILFSGAYEARLDVSWSSLAPLTLQIVQLQADALAIHLAALQPAP